MSEESNKKENNNYCSFYELPYTRKPNELKQIKLSETIILPKTTSCKYKISIKLRNKENNLSITAETLTINVHEIAAFNFEEIYEKKYDYSTLCKENRCFKIFDNVDESKKIIDEVFKNNINNNEKIFIDFEEGFLRIHLKMYIFDKVEEVVFSLPQKKLEEKEKLEFFTELLKENYEKTKKLEEENNYLKEK